MNEHALAAYRQQLDQTPLDTRGTGDVREANIASGEVVGRW